MSDNNLPPYPGASPAPDGQQPAAAPYGATPQPPAGQPAFGTTPPADPYGAGAQQPYGAPQQPYGGQQPYGTPQGYAAPVTPFDLGPALSYGWERFKSNAGVFIGGFLAWTVGAGIVVMILASIILGGTGAAARSGVGSSGLLAAGFGFGFFVVLALSMVITFLAGAGMTNAALVVTRTGRATFADFFKIPNVAQVALTALLVGLASGLVSFTGIGPIVVAFFAFFALHFALDKGLGAIDAIKASIDVAMKNVGPLAIFVIVVSIVGSLGGIVFVGVIVTVPIALLAGAFAYRRVVGEQPA